MPSSVAIALKENVPVFDVKKVIVFVPPGDDITTFVPNCFPDVMLYSSTLKGPIPPDTDMEYVSSWPASIRVFEGDSVIDGSEATLNEFVMYALVYGVGK